MLRRWRILLLAACVGAGAFAYAAERPPNVDDAFIVLVYARHLAQHVGFRWNLDGPPVDACTSFLDLLVKTAFVRCFPADPYRDAFVVGTAGFVACLVLGWRIAVRTAARDDTRWARAAAALGATALALSVPLAYGASFLLETPLFVAAGLASLVAMPEPPLSGRLSLRRLVAIGAAWSLLGLARPEGIAIAAVLAAGFVTLHRKHQPIARLAVPVAIAAAIVATHLAWHALHFGWLWPNSYYAKRSDSALQETLDGLDYAGAFLLTPTGAATIACALLAPAMALVPAAWRSDDERRAFAVTAVAASASVAVVVLGGGDGYGGARFFALAVALACAALVRAGVALVGRNRAFGLVPLAVIALHGGFVAFRRPSADLRVMRGWPLSERDLPCSTDIAAAMRRAGVRSFATTDYLRMKLFAEAIHVDDLSGLDDPAVAHRPYPAQDLWGKGDWSDGPGTGDDVLQLGIAAINRQPVGYTSTRALVTTPPLAETLLGTQLPADAHAALSAKETLVARYVPASIPVCKKWLNVFVRDDVASRIAAIPGAVVGAQDARP